MFAHETSMRAVAKASTRKIVPYVFAATLLAGMAAQASFAENAAPRPNAAKSPHDNAAGPKSEGVPVTRGGASTAGRQNPKARVGGVPPGRTGEAPAAKEALPIGKAGISSDAHTGDAGANDTPYPLPARGFASSPGNVRTGTSKFRIGTLANTHPQRPSVPARATPMTRNAIGMSVIPPRQIALHGGESHGAPLQVSVRDPAAIAASSAGNPAKTGIGLKPPTIAHSITNPAMSAAAVPRGTITGTGLFRPGSGSVGLGGPAKVVAGINGTGIRPRH